MNHDALSDDYIQEIFRLKKIAVVGMSADSKKVAHYVPKYLSEKGFEIIPINPNSEEILGKKCFNSISDIDSEIDVIEFFRPSDKILNFMEDVIKKKPKVIWLQEGIHNTEAEELAKKEGIKVVYNRCMLAEHQRLFK